MHNRISFSNERFASGWPDEERVQKIIAMDEAGDPATDQELTDLLGEMQQVDHHKLDWRVQVLTAVFRLFQNARHLKTGNLAQVRLW